MKYIVGITFLSLITLSSQVFGQASSCAQTLRLVQSTYEQGRLHELESLMAGCLKSGFDTPQKVSAYKYLTLAYIYLEEPEKADAAMLELLNADNFFKPNDAVDPAEFIALYRKFRVDPVFRFGFKFGASATMPAISETFFVFSNAPGNGKFIPKVNLSFGFVFEKDFPKFLKNFSIAPEILFTLRKYDYTNEKSATSDDVTQNLPVISIDQNLHKQNWIDLNLLTQYRLKENRFNPYISVGPGISYLLKSTNEIQTKVKDGTITGSTIITTTSYKSLAYSAIISVGSKIRFGAFYLTGDIRYQYGLNNIVNESTRSNSEALNDYGYVPPNSRQNNLTINLGLVIPHFSPKKLIK